MSDYFMSVSSGTDEGNGPPDGPHAYPHAFGAMWCFHGSFQINGRTFSDGDGGMLRQGDQLAMNAGPATSWVRFDISADRPVEGAKISDKVAIPNLAASPGVLLRLDQVTFPPSAVAWRHVHPGDGIRYLTQGELRIIGDDHEELETPGDPWFEAAHTPIRAEASADHATTSFVRFSVLPKAYIGISTLVVLDLEEAKLPRQQSYHRFFDEIVQLG